MRIKLIILCILLTGCATTTTYEFNECCVTEGIEHCSFAKIKSRREFIQGLNFKTCGTEFNTDNIQNGTSPLEQVVTQGIIEYLQNIPVVTKDENQKKTVSTIVKIPRITFDRKYYNTYHDFVSILQSGLSQVDRKAQKRLNNQ